MNKLFKEFIKEEKGQTLIEWIFILALILIIAIVGLRAIGNSSKKKMDTINDAIK